MARPKRIRPQRPSGLRGNKIPGRKSRAELMGVKKMGESTVKDTTQLQIKRKPAIQYDELGLPRVMGKGARIAHKKWLEENGYERD